MTRGRVSIEQLGARAQAQVRAALFAGEEQRRQRRQKYGAEATTVDGIRFDSKAEAKRWAELVRMQRAGLIFDLERQPEFPIEINGRRICSYRGDFRYTNAAGESITEDVKGVRTPAYILKRKLVAAVYGIEIVEVRA